VDRDGGLAEHLVLLSAPDVVVVRLVIARADLRPADCDDDLHCRRECVFSFDRFGKPNMKIKVVVHDAEEGGFWAEVPAIPGCATQGETMDELLRNLHEAIEGCLSVDVAEPEAGGTQRIVEIAV